MFLIHSIAPNITSTPKHSTSFRSFIPWHATCNPKVSTCPLFVDHGSVINQGATCAFPSVQLAPCTWFPPCRANRTPFASDDCSTPTNTTGSQVGRTHSTTMYEYYCKCISQLKVTSVFDRPCQPPADLICFFPEGCVTALTFTTDHLERSNTYTIWKRWKWDSFRIQNSTTRPRNLRVAKRISHLIHGKTLTGETRIREIGSDGLPKDYILL